MAGVVISQGGFTEEDRVTLQRLLSNPLVLPPEFKKWLIAYLEGHPPAFLESDLVGNRAVNIQNFSVVPATPFNNQLIRFQTSAMLTDGIHWLFVYNADSSSSYKWEFLGGPPWRKQVLTQETLSTTGSWQNIATAGPLVTVPLGGDYKVNFWTDALHDGSAGNQEMEAGVAIGDTTPNSPSGIVNQVDANSKMIITHSVPFSSITALDVLKLRYKVDTRTVDFKNRVIEVTPIRVAAA